MKFYGIKRAEEGRYGKKVLRLALLGTIVPKPGDLVATQPGNPKTNQQSIGRLREDGTVEILWTGNAHEGAAAAAYETL